MTEKLKIKWLHLYFLAKEIADFQPWNDFKEQNLFAYVWQDRSKSVYFSFIEASSCARGIACYLSEDAYMRARKLLESKGKPYEPVFDLQNALICLWDDREDVSKADYKLIKALGLKFRGRGTWLHFNKYETGYEPTSLNEKEIDLLITAFENLNMMLRAIHEQGLNPQFDKGFSLVRWYDSKEELYFTHSFRVNMAENVICRPVITMKNNDYLRKFTTARQTDLTLELDWSYLSFLTSDDNVRCYHPLLVLMVNAQTGYVIANELLNPSEDKFEILMDIMEFVCTKNGKPKEIIVCDEDIKCILTDLCKKAGIKLTLKKKLFRINQVKNELVNQFLSQ